MPGTARHRLPLGRSAALRGGANAVNATNERAGCRSKAQLEPAHPPAKRSEPPAAAPLARPSAARQRAVLERVLEWMDGWMAARRGSRRMAGGETYFMDGGVAVVGLGDAMRRARWIGRMRGGREQERN